MQALEVLKIAAKLGGGPW